MTIQDKILSVVNSKPISRKDIANEVLRIDTNSDCVPKQSSIDREITRLADNGKLIRVADGVYKKCLEETQVDLKKQNEYLKQQLKLLTHKQTYNMDVYDADVIRFGVVVDTHLGSQYENLKLLHHAYDFFYREGVNTVYLPGDVVDGEKMYPGHEYEIHTHGADAQVEYCVENFPQRDDVITKFILGNHDMSFWKRGGNDIGDKIAQKRPDMIYLGLNEADVEIKNNAGTAILRLIHPTDGTAYAISYKPQKYIESLSGGEKPNIVLCGHYHKSEFLCDRNIHFIQAGCCQYQTPFMRGRKISAMMGFYIVEVVLDENGVVRFRNEFFPCYSNGIVRKGRA